MPEVKSTQKLIVARVRDHQDSSALNSLDFLGNIINLTNYKIQDFLAKRMK